VSRQVDESLDRLEADILGPDSSPYRGGVFRLNITIPDRWVSVIGQVDESLDRLKADILGPDSSLHLGGVFRLNINPGQVGFRDWTGG
jgi:ubiquitin-protein ligase